NVVGVVEDRRGRIYASVAHGGVVEIVEGRAVPVPGSTAPPFSFLSLPFQDSRGDWWVACYNEGLFHINGPDLQFRRSNRLGPADGLPMRVNEVPLVTEDTFGDLWITCGAGIYSLDLARSGRRIFQPLQVNVPLARVIVQMSDRSGALWLG